MLRSVSAPSSVTNTSPCWNGDIVPGSTLMYGSSLRRVTLRPRDSRIAAREAAAIPLPREETTPPVTNTYFVIVSALPHLAWGEALPVKRQYTDAAAGGRPRERRDTARRTAAPALVDRHAAPGEDATRAVRIVRDQAVDAEVEHPLHVRRIIDRPRNHREAQLARLGDEAGGQVAPERRPG